MLKREQIITLIDNNEYSVVDLFEKNNKKYIYLVDINNHSNIIYGKVEEDEIIEINDPDELEEVIKLVNNHLHNMEI